MSTETKSKTGIFAILKNLFNSEPDIENYDDVKLSPELEDALKALKGKEYKAEQPINVDTKKSSNAGLAPKIDPKTEEAMRKMHNQQVRKEEDRER